MKVQVALMLLLVLGTCYCHPCPCSSKDNSADDNKAGGVSAGDVSAGDVSAGDDSAGDDSEVENSGTEEDGVPFGHEDYVMDDKTHRIGGRFNMGSNLGLGFGHGKNGFNAGLQKGLNFDWNGYAGTRNTHLRRQRPIYGFNPYGYGGY